MKNYRDLPYINFLLLLRIVGYLLVIESVFMVIPVIVALCTKTEGVLPFLLCMLGTGGCGALMMLIRPRTRDMGKREAIILTGFTWVVLSLSAWFPSLCMARISR